MRPENWRITLEAYLDGELAPVETDAFTDLAAQDPEVGLELEERLRMREQWRRALGNPGDDPRVVAFPHRRRFGWIPAALAACLLLALGLPRLLTEHETASHPIPTLTRSGQVAAPGFGEHPGRTAVLEPSALAVSCSPGR